MASSINISDYIISRVTAEGDSDLSTLKLQKLLYYCQSWYLAFYSKPLFEEDFQAWVHGPVNRELYNLYKESKFLYSAITISDITEPKIDDILTEEVKDHVNVVLETYAPYSAYELEVMTHTEKPWIDARQGCGPYDRCNVVISKDAMKRYYSSLLD